jgi:hypothetical protein
MCNVRCAVLNAQCISLLFLFLSHSLSLPLLFLLLFY